MTDQYDKDEERALKHKAEEKKRKADEEEKKLEAMAHERKQMKKDQEEANNAKKALDKEEKAAGDIEWAAKREGDKTVLQKIQAETTAKYMSRKSGTPPDHKFEKTVDKLIVSAKKQDAAEKLEEKRAKMRGE